MQRILVKESYIVDYAGFWWRLGAFIIDGVILWGINYLMAGLWNLATDLPWGGLTEQMLEAGTTTAPLWALRIIIFFVVQVGYFVCFWAWRGQTPGKWVMRIKITQFDGSPIGWGSAFLRYCGYIISAVILFIGFIWVGFDSRRQGIHDKIAETFVVRIPTRKERTAWQAHAGQVEVH
ncbi:MAG TPA: RDD family protein [Dehalococcoidales bacterium]